MNDLQLLFDQQVKNRWVVSQSKTKERRTLLLKLKRSIQAHRVAIAQAMYDDFRKPLPESELTEIHTAIDEINFAVKKLRTWMKPKKVKTPIVLFGSRSKIYYCLLYTSPSPRDRTRSRMPSSA